VNTPTHRNRLDKEESPYLTQHADNPVNWQPWDEAALEAAAERDVPIFLSVGYSACHWCHVMEEESFADEEVAALLNEEFVPIKVDREERPDVDSIYMTVCQLVTGRGGWPLSAWLTPDGRPFYVGTYFPKASKQGMPGFLDLLERLSESWQTDREEIENRANQWTEAARDRLEETPEAPAGAGEPGVTDPLEGAANAALRSADRHHGGFGTGTKFPQPTRIQALFRGYDRTGREEYLTVAGEALDAMAVGGLYDHLGGGFHRYCVDKDWTVPHFEKMLYDNAELPRAYLAGYQVTGEERYADIVAGTLGFVERELTHDDGAFFSTLDAQSLDESGEREEGAFYVWTPQQVHDELEDEFATDLFCARFSVTEEGNFEGQSVLNIAQSTAALATEFDCTEAEVTQQLANATQTLFEAREERPRPNRDEKVLAGWNGMMISAFAEASIVLETEAYATTAADALSFVRQQLWDSETDRLSRRYKDDSVAVSGYLEDYAFLARGALNCYEATGEVAHLEFALELARTIVEEFWDKERCTLYFTPESGETLVTRPQELGDHSTASSAGVAAEALLALDPFADEDFEGIVEQLIATHANKLRANPLEHITLSLAADRLEAGAVEITMATQSVPEAWRERLADTYLPDRLLARRPPTEEGLAQWLERLSLSEAPPIWADREGRDGEPTLYVCRSYTCSPPTGSIDDALEWLTDRKIDE